MTRDRKPSQSTCMILKSLNDRPEAMQYGYELMSVTGLKSGTLYPILMRLKDRGLLTSEWGPSEKPGRPPRQSYQLTPDGTAYARRVLREEPSSTRGFTEVRT